MSATLFGLPYVRLLRQSDDICLVFVEQMKNSLLT